MKKIDFFISVALSLLLVLPAFACELDEVAQRIIETSESSSFIQIKKVQSLSRSLRSNGMLRRTEDNSLIWQLQKPLKSTMIIEDNSVRQFDKNDILIQNITDSVSVGISNIFLALLSGDMASLQGNFSVALECDGSNWTLVLTPENDTYENIFSYISIVEENGSLSVQFEEARGDHTEISLLPIDASETEFLEFYLEN